MLCEEPERYDRQEKYATKKFITTKRELPPVPEAERHQHSGRHPVGSQPADSQLAGSRPVDSRLALQDRQVTERSAPEVDPQPSGNRQEKSRGSYLPKEKRPALRGSAEKPSKNGLFSRQTRIYHR